MGSSSAALLEKEPRLPEVTGYRKICKLREALKELVKVFRVTG